MRFILYLRGVNESHLVYRPVNVLFFFFFPVGPVDDGSHATSHVRKRLRGRLKTESNCPVQITVFTVANAICQLNLINDKKFVI